MSPSSSPTDPPADSIDALRRELARSQRELAACHQRMEQMEGFFIHVADAIFIAEPDGRIIDANPAASTLLGFTKQELLGKYPWDFVTSASRDEILATLQGLRVGEPVTVQRLYRTKSGGQKMIGLHLTRNHFGGRDLIIGACRDVTAQQEAQSGLEKALRGMQALKEEFQRAIDTTPGLIWSSLPDGHIDFLNRRWLDYTGLTMEQAGGWGWQAVVHPDDLDRLVQYWTALLASGEPGEIEVRMRRHDGVYRWFLFRGVPLFDAGGNLVKWYGQTTDMDDRKQAEGLLAGEKQLLEMMARGDALAPILEALCRLVQEVSGGRLCSILLLGPTHDRLWHGAAPSLPRALVQAVDGIAIGPETGPCGRAVYWEKPVNVPDIQADPFGCKYREPALEQGLRACWSVPIWSSNRKVLGTFALYSREPGEPSPQIHSLIEQSAHLASIAIERKQAADALRTSEHVAWGQLEAMKSTLDALVQESEPEKFLEHVLRTLTGQLGAHSIGVWELNPSTSRVELVVDGEDDRYRFPHRDTAASPKEWPIPREHPVWTEFFRSGKHCVVGDLDYDPLRIRIEGEPDAPWYSWQGDVVTNPQSQNIIKRLATLGIISTLCVPLFVAGKVTGLLSIRFQEHRTFRPEEIELTRALAHQAMLAIQLMRLTMLSRQSAVVAERNRMARDIHDTLAQGFTGIIVQLEAAADARNQELFRESDDHLQRASMLARESLQEARRSVRALRPQVLEIKRLPEALDELFSKMTSGTSLHAKLIVQGHPQPLSPEREENLLRIGQEVLTNTLRHAQASTFEGQLVFSELEVRLELTDNGRGFDPAARSDGFGLVGIRERALTMGGNLTLDSVSGQGTAVVIALPLARTSDSLPS